MSNKRSLPWVLIAVSAIAGASFVGIANAVKSQPETVQSQVVATQVKDQPAIQKPDENGSGRPNDEPTKEEKTVQVVERDQDDSLRLGSKKRPIERGGTKMESALNQSFKNTNYGELRALNVSVEDGVAIIDMNNKINQGFGSSEEAEVLTIFKKALAQFPEVKSFQLRVNGEKVDTLGHTEINDPVKVR